MNFLLPVFAAAIIGGIVMSALSSTLAHGFRGMAHVEMRGRRADALNTVRRRLNCSKTFETGVCPTIQPIALKDGFGKEIFEVDSETETLKVGDIRIKTECSDNTLKLYAAPVRGDFPGLPQIKTCEEVLGGPAEPEAKKVKTRMGYLTPSVPFPGAGHFTIYDEAQPFKTLAAICSPVMPNENGISCGCHSIVQEDGRVTIDLHWANPTGLVGQCRINFMVVGEAI